MTVPDQDHRRKTSAMGCGIRLKIEAGFGIIKVFEIGCGMKLQRRDRDKLHFEGGKWDNTGTCGIVNQLHTSV